MCNSKAFRVLKVESHRFKVDSQPPIFCVARKKVKAGEFPVVGDFVEISVENNENVIEKVLPRKNYCIRPQLSNLDQIVIVLAPVPQPDYYLLDKLIVNAHKQDIKCVLCVNKIDLNAKALFENIQEQYKNSVNEIIMSCAQSGEISELLRVLKKNLTAFAGQSAVGKSSLANCILGFAAAITGEMSAKLMRGKNTTTSAEIYKMDTDTFIVDTPGFSMLDFHGVTCAELDLYYNEYVELMPQCRFNRCTHTVEPDCAVKKAVEKGELSLQRYERYVLMRNELKLAEKNKY